MKNVSFAVGAAFTALLAFIIVCIDQLIKQFMPIEIGAERGFTYLSFVAWAVYFFAGCTLKGGIRAYIGYAVGIAVSILIMEFASVLSSTGFFAVPLAVIIIVFFVLYLEKVPWIDMIPAMFVASGCYFGMMTYIDGATYGTAACVEMIYGFIGLLFGWITITGKNCLVKMIEKK